MNFIKLVPLTRIQYLHTIAHHPAFLYYEKNHRELSIQQVTT
jgi:hypothetical protein